MRLGNSTFIESGCLLQRISCIADKWFVPLTKAIMSALSLKPRMYRQIPGPYADAADVDDAVITQSGMWVPGTLSRKLLLLLTAAATFCARQSNTPLSDADKLLILSRFLCMRMRSDVAWSLQHNNKPQPKPLHCVTGSTNTARWR